MTARAGSEAIDRLQQRPQFRLRLCVLAGRVGTIHDAGACVKLGDLAAQQARTQADRELTVAMMLARSQNRTASVIIFDLWSQGSFMQLSAFGVAMFAVLIVLVCIANWIGRRYGVKEQY